MKCEQYEAMIGRLVDGEAGQGPGAQLFTHLARCGDCREFLRNLLRMRNAAADLFMSDIALPVLRVGGGAEDRLQRTAGGPAADRPARSLMRARIRMSVPAAVITLVMLIVWTLTLAASIAERPWTAARGEEVTDQQRFMRSVLMDSRTDRRSGRAQ